MMKFTTTIHDQAYAVVASHIKVTKKIYDNTLKCWFIAVF